MVGLGGLAGLGGVYGGYLGAQDQDLQNRLRAQALAKQAYDLSQQQGGDTGLGQYIQSGAPGMGGGPIPGLGGLGQGPQGSPPIAPPGAAAPMPPPAAPPTGGLPASATPPPGGGPTDTFAQRFSPPLIRRPEMASAYAGQPYGGPYNAFQGRPMQPMGAGQPMGAPPPQQMPFTPQQQPAGGQPQPQQPPPQQQGGQPRGMEGLNIQQVLMGLARANPGASPQHLAAAAQAVLPFIQAGTREALATANLMLKQSGLNLQEQNLEERKRQFDMRAAAGGLGPRSAISQYLQQYRIEHPEAGAEEIKRVAQTYHTEQSAMNRFFSGTQSNVIRSLDNVVGHLGTLRELSDAMQAGDWQAINSLSAAWTAQTGGPAPTNLATAGQIVGPEVLKALQVAGAGTGEERAALGNIFNAAKSPEQFNGAVETARKLLARQFRDLRRQFTVATGLPASKFDEMLSPDVLPYLNEEASPGTSSGGFSVGAPIR